MKKYVRLLFIVYFLPGYTTWRLVKFRNEPRGREYAGVTRDAVLPERNEPAPPDAEIVGKMDGKMYGRVSLDFYDKAKERLKEWGACLEGNAIKITGYTFPGKNECTSGK